MSTTNPDIPDVPPEVAARQARPRALTAETAQLIDIKEHIDPQSGTFTGASIAAKAASAAARRARERAEDYAGAEPVRGLNEEQIKAVKALLYPDMPKYGPEGDRTQAFVNALWAKRPKAASIRYAYRDIWPTVLPAAWPPKDENFVPPPTGGSTVLAGATPGQSFSFEQVQALMEQAAKQGAAAALAAQAKPLFEVTPTSVRVIPEKPAKMHWRTKQKLAAQHALERPTA